MLIQGAGPAGSAAALSGLLHGASPQLWERSSLPRHKVCGEFLSPEILPILDKLGVAALFLDRQPQPVRRMSVRIGAREKVTVLPEPAFGLSRYAFDELLFQKALSSGASLAGEGKPDIVATGRRGGGLRGQRLFGFKAHFDGPQNDTVELYFHGDCYTGINAVEGGKTNVCGLAPESLLKSWGFDIDALLVENSALRQRLDPMSRSMDWMFTGPLSFGAQIDLGFAAGDALSFVDPFTGSGLLSAVATGSLAGEYCARGLPVSDYRAACRKLLSRPFEVSSALRWISKTSWAERLLETVPGQLLYWATRPRVAKSRWYHQAHVPSSGSDRNT